MTLRIRQGILPLLGQCRTTYGDHLYLTKKLSSCDDFKWSFFLYDWLCRLDFSYCYSIIWKEHSYSHANDLKAGKQISWISQKCITWEILAVKDFIAEHALLKFGWWWFFKNSSWNYVKIFRIFSIRWD